ncbi:MBL fold metallo-hydrolase [Phyllobacterium salinisoli]|uniref:MBL fold metallo-hydrolase n=1 Tax=Phyllobacterium salinisoli TaxID=1899321 RepID=A0A368K6Q8_9HYPH|nr:MBL fold metallo-hydrolase [Phyllobacterium salinisoli]RCS24052.1 MBL fold metallo-hydrolase [Phyllobacterium salinisoli]
MRVGLHGGFCEKGRTSVGIEAAGRRVLLDVGIKVGATGRDYYPLIDDEAIRSLDALFISHAHEDHVGGLSWLLSRGFRGRIFMTAETLAESPETLAHYGEREHLDAFPLASGAVEIFEPGDVIDLGGLRIATGRSGHVAGGVWFAAEAKGQRVVYSADVVSDSNVFVMDPLPPCDLLILDASYGADPISGRERAAAIRQWIEARPDGCLLPTPLSGRSLELMAIMPGRFAIHAAMRAALEAQLVAEMLLPDAIRLLRQRVAGAEDWRDGDPFPSCPLLTDDGMGRAGPSAEAISLADAKGYPILLTGHLPEGTSGHALHRQGRADWIRLPTHPTLSGLVDIWSDAGKPPVLGHSCLLGALEDLRPHLPGLRTDLATGDFIDLKDQ